MNKKYDINYSTSVERDHPLWGKPYINGRIKAFFIPSVRYGREIIELIQRSDLDYETVTIDRYWDRNKWGLGDFYDKRGAIWEQDLMYQNLENVLTSDEEFDVLVLPGINGWGYFTPKTRKAILERVERGTGLVLIHPFNGKDLGKVPELEKLSPLEPLYEEGFNSGGYPDIKYDELKKDGWIFNSHYINNGMPAEVISFNELGYYPYSAKGQVIIESESGWPIAAVKEYGKGRIVAFGYFPRDILPNYSFPVRGSAFDSAVSGVKSDLTFDYIEYFYSLINRSIIWAANREPESGIADVKREGDSLTVELTSSCDFKISYRIKNLYDQTVFEREISSLKIDLPDFMKLGGEYRVEVFLKDGSKVADWYTVCVNYPLIAEIKELSLDKTLVKQGDMLTVSIDTECCTKRINSSDECCDDGSCSDKCCSSDMRNESCCNQEDLLKLACSEDGTAILKVMVVDDFNRVLHSSTYDLNSGNTNVFNWCVRDVKPIAVKVQAEITINGHLIHKAETGKIIVQPSDRVIDDFEVFMTPGHVGRPDFMRFLGELFRKMGITCGFPGDSKVVTRSGASGLGVYWYRRAGYVERKENYVKTKDKRFLYREPCLNDPAFWEQNGENIIKTVGENKKFIPIAYFANDEGSLTCYTDELELCFCPHCMQGMREWLKGEYTDIEHLNQIWGTNFTDWDQVVPLTFEESRKTQNFASWGDHRLFMEITFANAYKRIRDLIRQEDPEGVVRMSGCQASTPYSGCDYYLLHEYVGYFEAYGVGNQMEFHRSFARPGTIIGGWTGYGVSGVNADHQIWSRLYHGLTLMSVFWQIACLNPDYTYSRSAMDMARNFIEIRREGIGKLLLHTAKRDNLGIAIHYSMPSVHGTYAMNKEQSFKDNRQGWINVLEDMGYQYDFVATQQIEAGELITKGYKLLILPYSIAISEKEAEEIKKFAENGGTVLADFQTGIMDKHCKSYDFGFIDDVLGITRYSTECRPFFTDGEMVREKDFTYFKTPDIFENGEFKFAEPGTRPSTGKAAYHHDFNKSLKSVIVNEYGKGKGIYLNFSLENYPELRKEDNGGSFIRLVLKELMNLAGIEKFGSIISLDGEPVEKGYETIYYSDGRARYMAIIRDFESNLRIGHDGLAVGSGEDVAYAADDIKIQLPSKAHVYDVRNKEYLGYTDCIESAIAPGNNKLYSLLPYTVEAIDVDIPQKVAAGSKMDVKIKVVSEKPESEYSNVVTINVFDPSGEFVWLYSSNELLKSGQLTKNISIPINEKTGIWKIVIKDAATGVMAVKEFEITA